MKAIDVRTFRMDKLLIEATDRGKFGHLIPHYNSIPRDKLKTQEREILEELDEYITNILDTTQSSVVEEIYDDMNCDEKCIYTGENELTPIKPTIINAPAGTGKSLVSLSIMIRTILDYGYKNGAIMYTPSYAAKHAVTDKIEECFQVIYEGNDEIIIEKTKLAVGCIPIYILNSFYMCGAKSFNIHNPRVASEVIGKFRRARYIESNRTESPDDKRCRESYHPKLNNIISMRETRTIILDEAFFSTKNRLKGFIRMLREGYLDHPFLNDLMREMCPPKFLDSLYKMKKIIFVGDPYQLAVSVEAKDAGIEKYLHEEGDPLWYYRHSFMGHVRMLDDLERYQLSTLTKNYRFSDVEDELASN